MSEHPPSSNPTEVCFHRGGTLRAELVSHLPFSVTSTVLGLMAVGVISFLAPADLVETDSHDHDHEGEHSHGAEFHGAYIEFFHLFHPAHMLFSAAATTAMFRRYDRRILRAVLVGFSGAVLVCGISDIAFPQLSLWILGKTRAEWHVCLFQHPGLVLPFAAVGVILGVSAATTIERSTYFSHALHVAVSTMASIFYLIGPMGKIGWLEHVGSVFFFTLVAVMIPCCFSDIFYPLLLTQRGREAYAHSEHAHRH